jgi:hypothetical protein
MVKQLLFRKEISMGITIHYKGQMDDTSMLPMLIEEIQDIADTKGWKSNILNEDWGTKPNASIVSRGQIEGDLGLKGISFSPGEGCESMSLFFDRYGHVMDPMTMLCIIDGTIKPTDACVHVKTQFANSETHIWIISILKYLKKEYISNLEVIDEGGYWETGDVKELEKRMKFLGDKINAIANAISSAPITDTDKEKMSVEEIASKIEDIIRNMDS